MKRLLCIVSSMDAGGAETFLMKVYRNIDRKKYQMDFCVSNPKKGLYDDEIKKLGGKIYYVPPKSKSFFKSFNGIKKIVRDNKYNNVLRISAHSLGNIDLIAAKFGGAKNLILRSSNANLPNNKKLIISHKVFKFLSKIVPTIKLAPSSEAAIFTFGKKEYLKGNVKILTNGIPVDNYIFNSTIRDDIRKELKINDKFVLGHVGRFEAQKNHEYLIDVFYEIYKKNKNAVLLLIGKGSLEDQIKKKVKKLRIENNVIFLGIRNDIPSLLMSMDVYVFPSLYEGMPNTVIEAQASGLPCIISNTITKECNITGLVKFLNINDNPIKWSNCVLNYKKSDRILNIKKKFEEKRYDINLTIDDFISYLI